MGEEELAVAVSHLRSQRGSTRRKKKKMKKKKRAEEGDVSLSEEKMEKEERVKGI